MKKLIIILLVLISAIISTCREVPELTEMYRPVSIDLDAIRERGKLVAVTDFNSTNYFIYKGEPMGFHYELLKSFADYIGVDLEIITENHPEHAVEFLNQGRADLVALGLTISSSRKKEMLFSDPILETRQVLVQRKPRNWQYLKASDVNGQLIRNQLDLANKTVFVQKGAAHGERLRSLSGEIGDSINIIEVPFGQEQLIKNVADGEIDYTICDENIARVNSTYYPGIDINTPVSFPQRIAWGMRKNNSEMLVKELNYWIYAFRRSGTYNQLYSKYFRNSRSSSIIKSDYYALNTGKVSQYDDLIKEASSEINWDWRLLASLIYQESRFQPDAKSWAGAYGLMQIMPVTGRSFGIDVTKSPANNIKAGIRYITWLHSIFDSKITNEYERMKFILASYNAGPGHVLDAMRLAEKNGMDPTKWNGCVEEWLQKKSNPVYYNDADVKSGYFRGTESVNFVIQVLDRYEHYKNILPEEPTGHLSLNSGR